MQAKPTTRLILLGALLLPGCQLKLVSGLLPFTTAQTPSVASAVPSPRPTVGPTPIQTAWPTPVTACDRTDPAAMPTYGNARNGKYNGQRLPNDFASLVNEADVTQAIARVRKTDDWACFQKFYPGAATVFLMIDQTELPPATPAPRPSASIGIWLPPPLPCRAIMASTVAINGMVFDQQGVPFASGVEVRVRNLNHSFSADAQVENGHYYVYGAPAGEKLEITAIHNDSGEARRRFVVPQAYYQDCGNEGFSVVNFGGPKSSEDAVGHRYPLPADASTQVQSQQATVKGQAFDLWGSPLDGAQVRVTSLSPQHPFVAITQVSNGSFAINGLPAGVPVEFRCEYPGYRARARVGVFLANGRSNVVNFGGAPTIEDPQGPQYGLAPLPTEAYRRPVVLRGKVRDIDGKVIRKGTIKVVSLEPQVPFTATVTLLDGQYVINNLPAGIEIEFMVEADGFEPTWRYERVRTDSALVNFGDGGDGDPEGASYGLVEAVEEPNV
jgi:hypothetical protein